MVIHYSILGVILFVSLFWNKFALQKKQQNPFEKQALTPWVIIFGYITFLAAVRSKFNDTAVYIYDFNNAPGTMSSALEAFRTANIKYAFTGFLQNVFKAYISDDYHMWFLMFALIESICFIYIYRRYCNDLFVPCYYFFTTGLYVNYFSMLRQWMAVAILFASLTFFINKKWVQFVICCVLAYLFHPSALVGVFVCFLAIGKPWRFKQIAIIVVAVVALLFMSPLLNSLESSSLGSTYDYALEVMNTNSGSSPLRAIITFIPVALSFASKRSIEDENNKVLDLSVNISVFYFFLNLVAAFTSGLYVVRLSTYLSPFVAILYSYLLTKLLDPKWRTIILIGFIVFYFLYYYYNMHNSGAGMYVSDILGEFR